MVAVRQNQLAIRRRWPSRQRWRSIKYEDIYLRAYETPAALRAGLTRYFHFYNTRQRHSALGRGTPDEVYFAQTAPDQAA